MQVKIDVKGMKQFQNKLNEIAKLSELQLLECVSSPIMEATQIAFETETDPWGNPWENTQSKTFHHLDSAENPHNSNDTGMRNDLHATVNSKKEVVVGFSVVSDGGYAYPAVHQFGSKKSSGRGSGIVARPFLPVDIDGNLAPEVKKDIEKNLNSLLESVFSS
ncbi:phage virion morphogenesis protein [Sulfurimonas sp.]|uniref:phage virion morphogenesis protein n=1 Tax=Sulfurimonas sp. TaxID=2022749 RepID=UPI002B469DB9|nr:phage virion morphogenesis protein [Sulfurimonas sp.]